MRERSSSTANQSAFGRKLNFSAAVIRGRQETAVFGLRAKAATQYFLFGPDAARFSFLKREMGGVTKAGCTESVQK